jgi:beta-mannosidase
MLCGAGANAIPVNIFHSQATPAAMMELVTNAVEANMNMLRIWGGGRYYPDYFYDYCDQAGLLVWQEAMFACSLYPANSAFLADVRAQPTCPSSGQESPVHVPCRVCCM